MDKTKVRLLGYKLLPADLLVAHFEVDDGPCNRQRTDGTEQQPLLLVAVLATSDGLSGASASSAAGTPAALRPTRTEHAKAPVVAVLGRCRLARLSIWGWGAAAARLPGACRLVRITAGALFLLEVLFEALGQLFADDPPVGEQFL